MKRLERLFNCFGSEDYPKAVEYFDKVINIDDNCYYVYFKRGAAKYEMGDKEGAMQDFQVHKIRILQCLETEECKQYDENDLETINKWLSK